MRMSWPVYITWNVDPTVYENESRLQFNINLTLTGTVI